MRIQPYIRRTCLQALLTLPLLFGTAHAQSADNLPPAGKVIKIIVPYSPGGTADILARKLALELATHIDRNVIIENRAGAGGAIGTEATVRSDADGSTMLLHSGAITIYPALTPNQNFDVERDLVPVTTAVLGPFVVLVNNDLPVKTMPELIAHAKAHPGVLNFGTPGTGTSTHLTTERLRAAAGMDMVHIPFRGASNGLNALIANDVQMYIDPLATGKRYAESGRVRALAVTTETRSSMWPEMPTVAESGVSGFDSTVWYGLFAPAKTPTPVVQRLNQALVAILKAPDMVAWLRDQGLEPVADTPQAAHTRMVAEIQNWKQVVRTNNITVD